MTNTRFRLPRAHLRAVALMLLVVHLGACVTWRPTSVPPPELITRDQPSQIRVVRGDGERVVLRRPELREGSVVGTGAGRAETTVPLADVRGVEVRRTSVGRTMAAFLISIGAGLLLLNAIACSDGCFGPS